MLTSVSDALGNNNYNFSDGYDEQGNDKPDFVLNQNRYGGASVSASRSAMGKTLRHRAPVLTSQCRVMRKFNCHPGSSA